MRSPGTRLPGAWAFIFAVALALLAGACSSSSKPAATPAASPQTTVTQAAGAATSPRDASYLVEGKTVVLTNGLSEIEAAPGSASKIVTKYFGNEATGDLNGDGLADVAFVLTQSRGGSGTFFYAVAALRTKDGYAGTNAVLLGDRIAPQSTEIRGGQAVFNYADRRPGEAFTVQPSVGVSKLLKVENGALAAVP